MIPRACYTWMRLIVALPLAIYLIGALVYAIKLSRQLSHNLAPVAAQAASAAIHRQVVIGKLDLLGMPGTIVLADVRVSNHATFAQDAGLPALTAKSVTVDYSPALLLFAPNGAPSAVGDVEVDNATAYVERLTSRQFNFSDLLPRKPQKVMRPFLAVVTVHQSTILFQDISGQKDYRNIIDRFTKVDARVDLRSPDIVYFSGHGTSPGGLFTRATVTGDMVRNADPALTSRIRQGLRVRVRVANADGPFFFGYFLGGVRPYVQAHAGRVDADVTVSQVGSAFHSPLDVQGSAVIRGGELIEVKRYAFKQPVTDIAGNVFFSLRGATLALTGQTAGIPIAVTGSIFGFPRVNLALAGSSPAVPVADLPRAFSFMPAIPRGFDAPAPGAVTLAATGPISDMEVRGSATLPALEVSGTRFTDLTTSITYARGLVEFKTITARHPGSGGAITAAGLVDTRTKPLSTTFSGSISNVELAELAPMFGHSKGVGPVSGLASVDFLAGTGRSGGTGGALHVAANFQVSGGAIALPGSAGSGNGRGYGFKSVAGRANWTRGGPLNLLDLVAQDTQGGILYARGAVPIQNPKSKTLDLTVNAVRIDAGPLLAQLGTTAASGEAFFSGQVGGSLSSPAVSGRLALVSPRYGPYSLDLTDGRVAYADGDLTLSQVRLDLDPAVATVSGTIDGLTGKNPCLALNVAVGRAEIADLIALIPPSALRPHGAPMSPSMQQLLNTTTGSLDSNLIITGDLKNLVASGTIAVTGATVDAYRIDDARGSFAYASDRLVIPEMVVHWENSVIDLSGRYDMADSGLDVTFTATGLDTRRAALALSQPDFPVSGVIDIKGHLAGTVESPTLAASVSSDQLTVAGLSLGKMTASGEYQGGQVIGSGPLSVSLGGGDYVVTAYRFDPVTGAVDISGHVDHATISGLVSLVRSNPYLMARVGNQLNDALGALPGPVDGAIDVPHFNLTGTMAHPAFSTAVTVSNLTCAGDTIDSANADLQFAGGTLTVGSLALTAGAGSVSASGSINPAGSVGVKLVAANVPLSMANPFLPQDKQLSGMLANLTVSASGKTASPDVTASIDLANPAVGAFSFDRIDCKQIDVSGGQIAIDSLTALRSEPVTGGQPIEHTASLNGSIPFSWTTDGAFAPSLPPGGKLSLHAQVPEQSMSVLSLFFPKIAPSNLTGQFSASVDLGGTIEQKSVTGQVQIDNGTLAMPGYATGLKDIDLDVAFNGDRATILTGAADSSAAGEVKTAGARVGPSGGSIKLTGDITFAQESAPNGRSVTESLLGGVQLNLALTATKFAVDEPKLTQYGDAGLSGVVDGSMQITENLLTPRVDGGLTVTGLVGTLPAASTTVPTVPPPPVIDPRFHLSLQIAPGAQIQAPQLQATTAGSFSLLGTLDRPNLHGNLVINSGKFQLPTATFKLASGGHVEVTYSPQYGGDLQSALDTQVDLSATTVLHISPATIAAYQPGLSAQMQGQSTFLLSNIDYGNDRYIVTVHVQGPLNDPEHLHLDFTSDPVGLSQQQILAALGGSAFTAFGAGDITTGFQTLLSQVLTTSISQQFLQPISNALGLDDFTVDYTPDAPLTLTVTKDLSRRLNFDFTRFVNARSSGPVASTLEPLQYLVELGYNLKDNISLRVSTDDQHDNTIGLDGVFHF